MNAVYIAWLLLAGWLFTFAARVALADLCEQQTRPGPSWCDCDPACDEVTRA